MSHKEYSGDTAKKIDDEIRSLVEEAYQRAKKLLTEHRKDLDLLSAELVVKEVMDIDEARELLGLAPVASKFDEEEDNDKMEDGGVKREEEKDEG